MLLVIVTVLSGLSPLVIPPPSRALFPLIVEESMTRVAAAVGLAGVQDRAGVAALDG